MTRREDLEGKVAVITGGGSGLGAAMARAFSDCAMRVAVLDIDGPRAAEVAGSLGGPSTSLRVDVGDPVAVEAAATHVEKTFGACHLLCANVGVQQFGSIETASDEDWRWLLDVNVLGTVRTVRAFLPLLRRADGWRQIALTASAGVFAPAARLGAYTATKCAMTGLGETLRLELAPEGIGVTVIFPGGMVTRHLESSALARPAQLGVSEMREEDVRVMLASRDDADPGMATPEDAIRSLIPDLLANEPYHITHGSYREAHAARQAQIEAAFARMERA